MYLCHILFYLILYNKRNYYELKKKLNSGNSTNYLFGIIIHPIRKW